MPYDAIVMGAGPAGLVLAAALAQRGLSVLLLSPKALRPFAPTYGVWLDEWPQYLHGQPLHGTVQQVWQDVRAVTTRSHSLGRSYALLNNSALLEAIFPTSLSVRQQRDLVKSFSFTGQRWQVMGQSASYTAPLLIDARGHSNSLRYLGGKAWQTAYGVVAHFARPPIAQNSMLWMDYGSAPNLADTFLYAMHLGDDRYFVEETSLIARPAPNQPQLAAKLWQRLKQNGTPAGKILAREWVCFPMNAALPVRPTTPLLAYGAAGGMVHPISGFQLTAAISKAEAVASILAESPDLVGVQQAWRWLWPPEYRAARQLQLLGAESLLQIPPEQLAHFFTIFFAQAPADWKAFLGHSTPASQLAPLMWRLFERLPLGLQKAFAQTAIISTTSDWFPKIG